MRFGALFDVVYPVDQAQGIRTAAVWEQLPTAPLSVDGALTSIFLNGLAII